MSHRLTLTAERLVGKTIESVDVVPHEDGDEPESGGYIVVHVAGMRLYADAPALYTDDEQTCRDCGASFPYAADADRCPACVEAAS